MEFHKLSGLASPVYIVCVCVWGGCTGPISEASPQEEISLQIHYSIKKKKSKTEEKWQVELCRARGWLSSVRGLLDSTPSVQGHLSLSDNRDAVGPQRVF